MSPEFAAAVDPILLKVLDSWESIQSNAPIDPASLHSQLLVSIREAEDRLRLGKHQEAWDLARYAICAWIDDLMINRSWPGQRWWENNKLEFQLFSTNDAGILFYQKAKQAQKISNRDAIEVFYIAVVLGFKGFYAVRDSQLLSQNYDLPATREEWARRVVSMLNARPTRPAFSGISKPALGAPPLEGKITLVGALLCFLMLSLLAVAVGYWGLYAR